MIRGGYTMPAAEYHAHPALSSSGARKLLPPYCPALFKWHRDNQQAPSRVFDFGHAAHKMVLNEGHELVLVDAKDYRTNVAKEARDAAYAAGKIPLLPDELATAERMVTALERSPAAALMQKPGKPEQSLFTQDEATGVWLRARIDWLPEATDGRMVLVDYKTTASAEPGAFARSVARYGYFQQAAWYLDIVKALGLADDVALRFVAQEKEPPYLVTVFELDEYALRIGRRRNREAIELFARCLERDEWPSYGGSYAGEVLNISLPAWMEDEEMTL